MATEMQKKAFKNLVGDGGGITKAMRNAKYSENTINTPQKLTESKGWKELLEEHLPDSLLLKVHEEGLEATFRGKPDYSVRHKYLDTGYKIKGKVIEKMDISGKIEKKMIIIND